MPTRTVLACTATLLLTTVTAQAQQSWPTHSMQLVVPWGPGSATDVIARIIAPKLSEALGHQVVVENRNGGAGVIGIAYVAAAPADGYTIAVGQSGTIGENPSLMGHLPYDPLHAFQAVAELVSVSYVITVSSKLPVHSIADLVAYGHANPGKLNFGTTGIGTSGHLICSDFIGRADIKAVHIPYAAAPQALNELANGTVSFMTYVYGNLKPYVDNGQVRPLATTGPAREDYLPDTPTMAESGFPDFLWSSWVGIYVPAATPKDIVTKLATTLHTILQDPDTQAKYRAQGDEVTYKGPDDFQAYTMSEINRYRVLLGKLGLLKH